MSIRRDDHPAMRRIRAHRPRTLGAHRQAPGSANRAVTPARHAAHRTGPVAGADRGRRRSAPASR
jgi:hypothetical protein